MKRLFICLIVVLLTTNVYAQKWRNDSGAETPTGSDNINNLDTIIDGEIVQPLDRVLADYRKNTALQYSSGSTLTVTAGEVVCSNSGETIRRMRRNTSSTSATFSDIDTGAESSSTTYYVYAVCDTDDVTTFTIKFSLSASSPSSTTYFKLLGSFFNDSGSDIDRTKIFTEPNGFINASPSGEGLMTNIQAYSSTSSFTAKDQWDLKVAYGNTGSITAGASKTISNLPFTSSSSYRVSLTSHTATNTFPPSVSYSSGSSFVVTNRDSSTTQTDISWIAIGH